MASTTIDNHAREIALRLYALAEDECEPDVHVAYAVALALGLAISETCPPGAGRERFIGATLGVAAELSRGLLDGLQLETIAISQPLARA